MQIMWIVDARRLEDSIYINNRLVDQIIIYFEKILNDTL